MKNEVYEVHTRFNCSRFAINRKITMSSKFDFPEDIIAPRERLAYAIVHGANEEAIAIIEEPYFSINAEYSLPNIYPPRSNTVVRTALELACYCGNVVIADYLHKKGANLRRQIGDGNLYNFAPVNGSYNGHIAIIRLFWSLCMIKSKIIILEEAVLRGACDIVDFCLLDPDIRNFVADETLPAIEEGRDYPPKKENAQLLTIACKNKDRTMIDILLNANCPAQNNTELSGPIEYCVRNDDPGSLLAIFCARGYVVEQKELIERILIYATSLQRTECLDILLNTINLNSSSITYKDRVLYYAIESSSIECTKYLLKRLSQKMTPASANIYLALSGIIKEFTNKSPEFKSEVRRFIIRNNLGKYTLPLLK